MLQDENSETSIRLMGKVVSLFVSLLRSERESHMPVIVLTEFGNISLRG